jgi:hypothetical protein
VITIHPVVELLRVIVADRNWIHGQAWKRSGRYLLFNSWGEKVLVIDG